MHIKLVIACVFVCECSVFTCMSLLCVYVYGRYGYVICMYVFDVEGWPEPYIYTVYDRIYLVIFLPGTPYIHRIYRVLANPIDVALEQASPFSSFPLCSCHTLFPHSFLLIPFFSNSLFFSFPFCSFPFSSFPSCSCHTLFPCIAWHAEGTKHVSNLCTRICGCAVTCVLMLFL